MRFTITATLLAAAGTALALPGNNYPVGTTPGTPGTGTGVDPTNPGTPGNGGNPPTGGNGGNTGDNNDNSQVNQQCGGAQLSCCQANGAFTSTPANSSAASGLLGLLGVGSLLDGLLGGYTGCNVLSGLGSCNDEVVCCNPESVPQFGLVNVAIPCIPVNVL